jgi:hypothetical protein
MVPPVAPMLEKLFFGNISCVFKFYLLSFFRKNFGDYSFRSSDGPLESEILTFSGILKLSADFTAEKPALMQNNSRKTCLSAV